MVDYRLPDHWDALSPAEQQRWFVSLADGDRMAHCLLLGERELAKNPELEEELIRRTVSEAIAAGRTIQVLRLPKA